MSTVRIRLQPLLAFDAATCVAMGALLLATSETIAALTHLPASLLFWAGAVLLPIAVFIGGLSRVQPPRWAVMVVIIGNIAWGLASIALPTLGLVQPNALGWTFVLGQAAVVLLLAVLEYGTPVTAVATR